MQFEDEWLDDTKPLAALPSEGQTSLQEHFSKYVAKMHERFAVRVVAIHEVMDSTSADPYDYLDDDPRRLLRRTRRYLLSRPSWPTIPPISPHVLLLSLSSIRLREIQISAPRRIDRVTISSDCPVSSGFCQLTREMTGARLAGRSSTPTPSPTGSGLSPSTTAQKHLKYGAGPRPGDARTV